MNKIGVNIDLSVFFEDERKLAIVMVDPKWESVECLQKRVQFLFGVDLVRFLNSDGYFLPPQEPIEIIKFCKGLKAFVPKEYLEKRKKKKSKKVENEDKSSVDSESEEALNSEQNDLSQKKRKLQSGITASAKRLKNCLAVVADNAKQINKSSEISSTSEQMPPPPLIKGKKSKKSHSSSCVPSDNEEQSPKTTVDNENENSRSQDGNDHSKGRRSPTPQENIFAEIVDNVKRTFDDQKKVRPSSIHSSTLICDSKIVDAATPNKTNPFKKGKSLNKNHSKGHIYFNESGKMVNTSIETSKSVPLTEKEITKSKITTVFHCSLNDVSDKKPRVFQINSLSKSLNKPLLEIQEDILIQAKPLENSVMNESLERTDSEQQINSSKTQTTETTLQNNTQNLLASIDQEKSILNDTTTTEGTTTITNSEEISMQNKTTIAVANDQTIAVAIDQSIAVATDQTTSMENSITSENLEDQSIQDDCLNDTNFKTALNESSVLSIDSVDLSIVIDDEEDERKNKTQTQQQTSHDLTADDDRDDDDSSDVEEISDIIDLNETEDNCDSTVNSSSETRFRNSKIVVHKVLPFCEDMLDLPNIGDIVVFKVPYINKKLKQTETNFIAGIAEYINKRTKTIKIMVKDGLAELPFVPNKFVCHLNETEDQFKYLQLKLSDMLEPKFCTRA